MTFHTIKLAREQIKWSGPTLEVSDSSPSASSGTRTTTTTTFREYSSSPGTYQGFCSKCGSLLTSRSKRQRDQIGILCGILDERFLVESSSSRSAGAEVEVEAEAEEKGNGKGYRNGTA